MNDKLQTLQAQYSKKVLITGAGGQLGTQLNKTLNNFKYLDARTRNELDIAQPYISLKSQISKIQPDIIINTAAYTDVDKAEENPDQAYQVNAESVLNLARICASLDITLVHYSTDYVFDGRKETPYHENDKPSPLSVYGESKLVGERHIILSSCRHIILRTSWLYGRFGKNFAKTIAQLAEKETHLKVISDQISIPTSTAWLADVTNKILHDIIQQPNNKQYYGLFHCTPMQHTSWYGFAEVLLKDTRQAPPLISISSSEYHKNMIRPKYSVLNSDKLKKTFCITLPTWQELVDDFINHN